MGFSINDFKAIDLQTVKPGKWVDEKEYEALKEPIGQFKYIIDEELRIIDNSGERIPIIIKNKVRAYAEELTVFIQGIVGVEHGDPKDNVQIQESRLRGFRILLEKHFRMDIPSEFLCTFSIVKAYGSGDKSAGELQAKVKEAEKALLKIKSDESSIKSVMDEVNKIASEITTSDYSNIFKIESQTHGRNSYIWLAFGLILIGVFIALFFTGIYRIYFETETILDNGVVKYNISNMIIKGLLFAIQIFVISFSFKQFAINRHLATINKHRQNGLESYKLFIETVSKEDVATRNNLMLQLAKAIYEQVNTGYIGDKGGKVNSGLLEIISLINSQKSG